VKSRRRGRAFPFLLFLLPALGSGCASLTGGGDRERVATTYEEAMELVSSSEPEDRVEALEWFGADLDPRGLETAVSALGDESVMVRLAAVLTVREYSQPDTIRSLRPLLEDENLEVRYAAATALFDLGDYSGLEQLVEGMKSEYPEIRHQAMMIVAKIRSPRGIPGTIALLGDIEPRTRSDAAYILGEIYADPSAVPALLNSLDDQSPYVRKDAWESLKKITGQNHPFDWQAGEDLRAAQREVWIRWLEVNPEYGAGSASVPPAGEEGADGED